MKSLVDFINDIQEGLKVDKDSQIAANVTLDKYPNKDGVRNIPKEDIIKLRDNDELTNKIYKALIEEFDYRYSIKQMWSGTVNFYRKGSRCTMKDLICSISSNAYIDFGGDDKLANKLGDEIFNVIDNVN